jgi:hypothetical protein
MDLTRADWRKSSHSANGGDTCVEVATAPLASGRKSSYSANGGNTCVEVGNGPRAVAVRDSQDPEGAALAFSRDDWQAFTRTIKAAARRP